MRKVVSVLAIAGVLALSACSPSKEADSELPPGSELDTEIAAPAGQPESPAQGDGKEDCAAEDFQVTGQTGSKPKITVPTDCAPPADLIVHDVEEGDGAEVTEGSTVEMHFTLYAFSTGKEIQSSFDSGQTFPVENVGHASVIDGWNEGLVGMHEGGRRLLVVPPELGYGEQGDGNQIKPGETLVFVVGAVDVQG